MVTISVAEPQRRTPAYDLNDLSRWRELSSGKRAFSAVLTGFDMSLMGEAL